MSEQAVFKINLRTGEIEISGSEQFVERRIEQLEDIIKLSNIAPQLPPPPAVITQGQDAAAPPANSNGANGVGEVPASFGEWLYAFKDNANDIQKALITARYVQFQAVSNDFKTAEVNKSLKDHGIKLSNPSQSLKQLVDKKYIFQTRKVGTLKFMRVSADGQKHLDSLKRHEG